MKKKWARGLFALILIVGMLALPSYFFGSIPTLTLASPKKTNLQESIKVNGLTQLENCCEITASFPVIAEKIAVTVGQTVEKGSFLFSVDKLSTRYAYLFFLEELGFSPQKSLGDFVVFLTALPDDTKKLLEEKAGPYLSFLESGLQNDLSLEEAVDQMLLLIPKEYYAPQNGVVREINLSFNSLSDPTKPLMSIGGAERAVAVLRIPEKSIKKVQVGQQVTMKGDTFSGEKKGVIREISETAVTPLSLTDTSPVFLATVVFAEEENLPPVGTGLTATLRVGSAREALLLPYSAISQEGEKEYVTVFSQKGLEKVYITTGSESAKGVEICSGISKESLVLLSPPENLPIYFRIQKEESQ